MGLRASPPAGGQPAVDLLEAVMAPEGREIVVRQCPPMRWKRSCFQRFLHDALAAVAFALRSGSIWEIAERVINHLPTGRASGL